MSTSNSKYSTNGTIFRVLRQMTYTKLFKKYSSGNFSYAKILANNLIFNDNCRVVARFKDFLIYDDNTEFLRRFYTDEESHPRLIKILNFYEAYSKIFPNYMILKESKYLYRNIRKKQKMIDAVNEIKREEEENRKKMKQNNKNFNKEINSNQLFTALVKKEIKTFQKNTTPKRHKNFFDSDYEEDEDTLFTQNSISISLLNKKKFIENLENEIEGGKKNEEENENDTNRENEKTFGSFIANETNHSISGILNIMDDSKIRTSDLRKLLENNDNENNNIKNINIKNNNENKNKQNKKLDNLNKPKTSHRNTISSSNLTTNSNSNTHFSKALKKISTPSTSSMTTGFCYNMNSEKSSTTNYQNIIIPKGNAVITINNNFYEHVSPKMKDSSNIKCKCKNSANKNVLGNNNNNFIQISERKKLKTFNTNNISNSNKKNKQLTKFKSKKHSKQISQDFNKRNHHIHTDSKSININDMEKIENKNNEKNIENNNENKNKKINIKNNNENKNENKNEKNDNENNNNENGIQEKIIKFGSLSPQPMISNISDPTVFQTNDSGENNNNNSKEINSKNPNFYTEQNRNPNLITADTKGDNIEDEDDEKKREKLLFNIRDIIEKEQQEKIKTPNIKHSNTIKQKTISHFHPTSFNKRVIEKIEYKHEKNPVLQKKTGKYTFVSSSLTATNNENKNQKINYKISYNKLNMPNKNQKANTKSLLKTNFTKSYNKNNIIHSNSSKKKIFHTKNQPSKKNFAEMTNNNSLTTSKNNLMNPSEGLSMNKILSTNEKIINKTKLLNRRNLNDKLLKHNCKSKNSQNHLSNYNDKNFNTLSQSIVDKSPNSKLSKLLMSYNKNDINNSSGNILNDSRRKEIRNLKYKKDDFLISPSYNATYEINNNNQENDNSKEIIKTEYKFSNSISKASAGNLYNSVNEFDNKISTNETNSKNVANCSSTYEKGKTGIDLRNKYKSFMTKKKNKQNSCDFNSQSSIPHKLNQELLERINKIKYKSKNNFYDTSKTVQKIPNNLFESTESLTGKNDVMRKHSNLMRDTTYKTPSINNKQIGLYKRVAVQKSKILKSDKQLYKKKLQKNFPTPGTIKVNRSKFLGKLKGGGLISHCKMNTMYNFNYDIINDKSCEELTSTNANK